MRDAVSSRRRSRVRRVVALTGVLLAAVLVPSYAAPDPTPPVPPLLMPTQAMAPNVTPQEGSDYPGAEDLPPLATTSVAGGSAVNSQVTVVNRSRMVIKLGPETPIWAFLYFGEHNWPMENPTTYAPPCSSWSTGSPPCVPNPFYQPDCATDDPSTQVGVMYTRSRIYPARPLEGGGADVGFVGETRVNLVAFGSVPASATLTMRVPVVNGEVQYLMNHMWDPVGVKRMPGCDPAFDAPFVALVEGELDIWISDLVVDGVPVDIGTQCRTERPAELQLWGDFERGGYIPYAGGDLGAEPGLAPGTLFPLDHPIYQEDNGREFAPSRGIEVPPFTGCVGGGDDLSPLVTAMASGSDNPVRVKQSQLVPSLDGNMPIDNLTKCNGQICPQPPEVPETPPFPWENSDAP